MKNITIPIENLDELLNLLNDALYHQGTWNSGRWQIKSMEALEKNRKYCFQDVPRIPQKRDTK